MFEFLLFDDLLLLLFLFHDSLFLYLFDVFFILLLEVLYCLWHLGLLVWARNERLGSSKALLGRFGSDQLLRSLLFDNCVKFALHISKSEFLLNLDHFLFLFFLFLFLHLLLLLVGIMKTLQKLNVLVLIVDLAIFFSALLFIDPILNEVCVHLLVKIVK